MQNFFFTSDTHFGHQAVITKMGRIGFSSIEEHDTVLLENINKVVKRQDRLFILGDFAWSSSSVAIYRKQIICPNVSLIIGNHDRSSVSQLKKQFEFAGDTKMLNIDNQKVFLSHYPHAYWPCSHYGAYHLYGHMHGQREKTLDELFPDRHSMDIGIDVAGKILGQCRPFHWEEIKNIMSNRVGHDQLSFYRQNCNI